MPRTRIFMSCVVQFMCLISAILAFVPFAEAATYTCDDLNRLTQATL